MEVPGLETRLGYKFSAAKLLQQALTHRSHSAPHNERLEFLGDSVLNCAVAHLLFERYTKLDEGDLSRLRSNLVKQQTLYEIAQRIELAQYLRLGEGELKSGGFRRPSILADTMEALFGAIFLDGGFDRARLTIAKLYHPILETVDPQTLGKDAKTLLQEYLQGRKIALPTYNVVATHGAAHNQEFEVECLIPKLEIRVTGAGASRRAAEQAAAKKALELAPKEAPKKTKRARKDNAKEGGPEAVKEGREAAAREAKEAAKESAVKESSSKEAPKEPKDAPKEARESVPEEAREEGRRVRLELVKDPAKEVVKETAKEPVKEGKEAAAPSVAEMAPAVPQEAAPAEPAVVNGIVTPGATASVVKLPVKGSSR
jgi:ribonuclease-3